MENFKKKFAELIYAKRKERGFTQDYVAQAISVSVRWYQRIESGARMPSSKTLLRLIVFFEIDLMDFREEVELVEPVQNIRGKIKL